MCCDIIATSYTQHKHIHTHTHTHTHTQRLDRVEELQGWVERHKYHIQKLEVSYQPEEVGHGHVTGYAIMELYGFSMELLVQK